MSDVAITKKGLLAQFQHIENNFMMGFAAYIMFIEEPCVKYIKAYCGEIGSYQLPLHEYANRILNGDRVLIQEFMKSQMRALGKESFDILKNYLITNSLWVEVKPNACLQFARIIRNALSHNFCFEFGKHEKSILPVTWHGRTINSSMEGQELTLSFYSPQCAWELFNDLRKLIKDI